MAIAPILRICTALEERFQHELRLRRTQPRRDVALDDGEGRLERAQAQLLPERTEVSEIARLVIAQRGRAVAVLVPIELYPRLSASSAGLLCPWLGRLDDAEKFAAGKITLELALARAANPVEIL